MFLKVKYNYPTLDLINSFIPAKCQTFWPNYLVIKDC